MFYLIFYCISMFYKLVVKNSLVKNTVINILFLLLQSKIYAVGMATASLKQKTK